MLYVYFYHYSFRLSDPPKIHDIMIICNNRARRNETETYVSTSCTEIMPVCNRQLTLDDNIF